MQEGFRRCNCCHQYIPASAIRTLIKSNGEVRNITGLNPVYSHLPLPPEPDDRVLYHDIETPLRSKKEVPVFFHHPDNSFRDSLKEIARKWILFIFVISYCNVYCNIHISSFKKKF